MSQSDGGAAQKCKFHGANRKFSSSFKTWWFRVSNVFVFWVLINVKYDSETICDVTAP